MKNIFLSTVAFITLTVPVLAQTPTQSWTGIYGGLDLGGAWGNGSFSAPGKNHTINQNVNNNGLIGGGFIGYNYEFSNYVIGVQGGIDATGGGKSRYTTLIGSDRFQSSLTQNWIASTDLRLGWTFGTILPYAIGGAAWSSQSAHLTDLTNGAYHGANSTPLGYDVGAGVEYAITPNWTGRAEYRYYNFASSHYSYANPLLASTYYRTTLTENVFRLGAGYKF